VVDERPPLTLTSDKSAECYRNWWPGPGDDQVALMNRSIDLLEELAVISGRKAPRIRIPHLVALGFAHADAFVSGKILGRTPRIPLEGVRTAREVMFASSARAVRALGFRQTPIREALTKAVRWFEERGHRAQRGAS